MALRAGALADFRPVYVVNLTGRALQRGRVSPVSSFYGDGAGNHVGTVDLDGDGNADWWRTGTDQGEGGFLFIRDGDTFRSVYTTGYARDPHLQFFDLNHNGGTDVLVTTATDSFNDPFAAVVDGRTGAVLTLAKGSYYGDPPVYDYSLAVVDLDHNRLPDLELRTVSDPGVTVTPQRFENKSKSGAWNFRDVTPPAAP